MKFLSVASLLFVSALAVPTSQCGACDRHRAGIPFGSAVPVSNAPYSYDSCPSGLYSNPQCCSTDVLGIADLDCNAPSSTPTSGNDFRSICSREGKQAKCCVIPVAGQAVLCKDAVTGWAR